MSRTYLVDTNFWSPFDNDNDEEGEEEQEEINMIKSMATTPKQKENEWTTQIFMSKVFDLPTEGTSNKEVYLPNNAKLRTSR